MPASRRAAGWSPYRARMRVSFRGMEAPQRDTMRSMELRFSTGMMPASMGTSMPAMRQRSRKRKKSSLSKNSWLTRCWAPASTFCFR